LYCRYDSYNVELVRKVFMECVDQDFEQMCRAFFYIRGCMATDKKHENLSEDT